MIKFKLVIAQLNLLVLALFSANNIFSAQIYQPLPEKMTNNAVAAINSKEGWVLYSFNGLGSDKNHKSVSSSAWSYSLTSNQWSTLPAVPDSKAKAGGRLASVAVAVDGKVYLFGGYTVSEDHNEISTPETNVFDPQTSSWRQIKDMPIPVDDSVAVVYKNRFIYLISGWHNDGNVKAVQILDTNSETWSTATDFPGSTVFGHAAGIVDDKFIVANGVKVAAVVEGRREYQLSEEVWQGTIDKTDHHLIKWQRVEDFPSGGRYRMAAVADSKSPWIHFVGGSKNPYNFNGVGYNGVPSNPEEMNYAFDLSKSDLSKSKWLSCGKKLHPTMDHRGLLAINDQLITIGGMLKDQEVTSQVLAFKANCH